MTKEPEIEKPTSEELAKYVGDIAQKVGFSFDARKSDGLSDGLIQFSEPEHFYWTIRGGLPLIYDGKKAELKFITRDVYYINALGRATDGIALFRYSGVDGERRFNDVEETLIFPELQVGCKRERCYYDSFWRQKIGRTREEFKSSYGRDQESAKDIRLMLEEARRIVREQFPNLTEILDSPHYWARENYGQPVDDVLNAEYSLLKTERSLLRKVECFMRRLF